jgi:2-dehydro-3-deoxyglucarate aldolase/4-hydroxy-2-oxoheptanedioate aldolase
MNELKEKLQQGKCLAGTHVILNDSSITEMISNLSFDFIWIDTEHSAIDYQVLQQHLIAARAGNTPAIVRVPWNNPILVKRVLEQGPDGIVFPVINTAEEADLAMKSCLYPPIGNRGFGPIRAIKYGYADVNDYIRNGHKEICRFIQIESEQAVNNLKEILDNPYIDGLIVGACDLSGSIGELNNVFGSRTLELIDKAVKTANEKNVPIGISTGASDFETIDFWRRRGMKIISAGMDYISVWSGANAVLENIRKTFTEA